MNVIVVGSGIAGSTAALHAHEAGHDVTIVTKGALGDGCTGLAQGGVAGVYGPGDSAAQHAADTIDAGAGLSYAAAVDVLVADGAERIAELIARGVAFDRTSDGSLQLGREAAHQHARIVHAGGDATGAAISAALVAAIRRTSITVIEHALLTDLVMVGGSVRGIRMLRAAETTELSADAVVLATGGAGHLYAHTTNPAGTTGDGIAVALRAGAAVADLEFVQFHPTILASSPAFLISEAVRGEGATLLDSDGHRFTFDSHPDGELAPRDVVSRAIARQAAAQGMPVRLDATMLGADTLARRFPTIDRVTRERGFDWSTEPIPVTPAAHYLMGGIVTDLDGRTTVPGLFAVGEVARTGVHGANRLASNSLLEGAVFGARAAAALTTDRFVSLRSLNDRELERPTGSHPPVVERGAQRPDETHPPVVERGAQRRDETHPPVVERGAQRPDETHPQVVERGAQRRDETHPPFVERGAQRPDETHPPFTRAALQQLMWDEVGLLRTGPGLTHALDTVRAWAAAAPAPTGVAEHEDANLLLLAEATAAAALRRTASVGAHHRVDAAEDPAATPTRTSILETV